MRPCDRHAGSNRTSDLRRPANAGSVLPLVVLAALLGVIGTDAWSTRPDRAVHATAQATVLPDGTTRVQPRGAAHDAVRAVERYGTRREQTTFGAVVLDRWTGEVAGSAQAAAPQYTASVVKLVLAVDVLQRRHHGLSVTEDDRRLLRRALGPSDDDAMNTLWTRFDGQGAVTRVARQLKLSGTRPPADSAMWGEATMSAWDVAAVFQHVLSRMPRPDREFILRGLADAPKVAIGGFDQGFGLEHIDSRRPAVKAGWMCCTGGDVVLHSAGILGGARRFVVVLLSSQPDSRGYDGARELLTDAAERLTSRLP